MKEINRASDVMVFGGIGGAVEITDRLFDSCSSPFMESLSELQLEGLFELQRQRRKKEERKDKKEERERRKEGMEGGRERGSGGEEGGKERKKKDG